MEKQRKREKRKRYVKKNGKTKEKGEKKQKNRKRIKFGFGQYFGYSGAMQPVLKLQWMMVAGTQATMGVSWVVLSLWTSM